MEGYGSIWLAFAFIHSTGSAEAALYFDLGWAKEPKDKPFESMSGMHHHTQTEGGEGDIFFLVQIYYNMTICQLKSMPIARDISLKAHIQNL